MVRLGQCSCASGGPSLLARMNQSLRETPSRKRTFRDLAMAQTDPRQLTTKTWKGLCLSKSSGDRGADHRGAVADLDQAREVPGRQHARYLGADLMGWPARALDRMDSRYRLAFANRFAEIDHGL